MSHSVSKLIASAVSIAAIQIADVSTSLADAQDQPNILFILSDDHTSQAWGCYGGRLAGVANTPNIDRLASEGVRLENAFCVNSICVPSRASILTGQYSHINGVAHLSDALDPKRDNLAKQLRSAGYQTALVGKWHLKNRPSGFDYWNIIKGQGRYHEPVMYEMDLKNGKPQEGKYSADAFTDIALDWLEQRDTTRPFALSLHFKATHEPWNYPKRLESMYEGIRIPEPPSLHWGTGPTHSRVPGWPLTILTERMTQGSRHGGGRLVLNTEDPREIRKATYQKFLKDFLRAGVAIDENIGRALDFLERHNLAHNTLVIYTSDQGYFLGEHNYFDKRFMLEQSLRMPFVARLPGVIPSSSTIDDIILNVDFAPTLLDFANQPIPESMQGRSFRAQLTGKEEPTWRRSMYYRYHSNSKPRPAHFGVRTHIDKLIYYDGLEAESDALRWEYYHLVDDPGEYINAYDNPKYQDRIAHLKTSLRALQSELQDTP